MIIFGASPCVVKPIPRKKPAPGNARCLSHFAETQSFRSGSHLAEKVVPSQTVTDTGGASPIFVTRRAETTAPENEGESTFLATVTRVEINDVHHPYLNWVVVLGVDKLTLGPPVGEGFWFAIHSPSQEGVKVGQR